MVLQVNDNKHNLLLFSYCRPTCRSGNICSSVNRLFWTHGNGWDTSLGSGDALKDNHAKWNGNDVGDWDFSELPSDGKAFDFLTSGSMKGWDKCYM